MKDNTFKTGKAGKVTAYDVVFTPEGAAHGNKYSASQVWRIVYADGKEQIISTTFCSNPYQSAEKLSKQIKSSVQQLIKSNREYSANSFKDIAKFDSYIYCAKKNQGENSEDAKKILELKNEILKFTDMSNKEAIIAQQDSAKNAKNKEYITDIATQTQCPKDNYTGGDKETIKKNSISAWAKDEGCLAKYQILKVYITGDSWTKEKGYDYSKSTDSFKKVDESYLNVAIVFVPKDKSVIYNNTEIPDVAQIFRYALVKDHINSGKINYVNFECHHIESSGTDLLSSNTKGKYILKTNVK